MSTYPHTYINFSIIRCMFFSPTANSPPDTKQWQKWSRVGNGTWSFQIKMYLYSPFYMQACHRGLHISPHISSCWWLTPFLTSHSRCWGREWGRGPVGGGALERSRPCCGGEIKVKSFTVDGTIDQTLNLQTEASLETSNRFELDSKSKMAVIPLSLLREHKGDCSQINVYNMSRLS